MIARLDMERRNYPLTVLHEYRMTPEGLLDTLDWIAASDLAVLRGRTGTSPERMELVPLACEVLRELIEVLQAARDRRLGLWHPRGAAVRTDARPPARPRSADRGRADGRNDLRPACRASARSCSTSSNRCSRMPTAERLRLIKAACLLHDTTWRAHPDYRAEVCFDNATRANLGGLDHPGRVFLGLALLHRYKNSRAGSRLEPLFRLLTDDEIRDAEVLGKAMRFGAMFSVGDPATGGHAAAGGRRKRQLELELTPLGEGLVRRSGAGAVHLAGHWR